MVEILPSILSADFARLGEDIARMERAGVSMLHVDVMDGHFVPNLTLGPPVVKSIRKVTKLTLDVHLMITDPDRYAPVFIEAGADQVSVHQETCPHLDRTLRMIQSEGALAGVVINPSTPVATLDEVLDLADYVLVMSVNPGFGGQQFLPNSLRKVQALAERRERNKGSFRIEMDGGLGPDNIAGAVRAGCDWVVAGSSIFGSEDPETTVKRMQQLAREATAIRV
ncbi:MAG: ribulose-phosphate 3-epimerase [Acidobacteria bacterium]|nr:ribulose-phosphate 3-epimerase [Acidobacteriota bacterium]